MGTPTELTGPNLKGGVRDAEVREGVPAYHDDGRVRAVATIGRDRLALQVEAAMARDDDAAVRTLVA